MKKVLGFICALIFVMGVYGVAGAATITFDPNPVDPDPIVGSTFDVSIIAFDFPETDGGDVLIEWNPAILSISASDITYTWPGDITGDPVLDASSGSLSVGIFLDPSPSGSFGIADLTFTAFAEGTSPLTITSSSWVGPLAAGFPPIDVTDISGTVTVAAPVPIPGSILLLGSGLVGLVGLVRRRRS